MKFLITLCLIFFLSSASFATQEQITVKFKPGASSATYQGSVKGSETKRVGERHDSYTLGASKGQIMTVDVTSTGPVSVYVWRRSLGFNQGYMLNSTGESSLNLRFALPANDDYVVNVEQANLAKGIDYDIKFSIR